MTQQDQELEQIKSKIQDHLISSGNYDKINKHLKLKLFESGWYDNVSRLTVKELEDTSKNSETMTFEQLFSFVKPKAEDMVSPEVKEEVLQRIREYLEDTIQ